jgi:hypothetical protein
LTHAKLHARSVKGNQIVQRGKHNGEPDRTGLVWQILKGWYVGKLRAVA